MNSPTPWLSSKSTTAVKLIDGAAPGIPAEVLRHLPTRSSTYRIWRVIAPAETATGTPADLAKLQLPDSVKNWLGDGLAAQAGAILGGK